LHQRNRQLPSAIAAFFILGLSATASAGGSASGHEAAAISPEAGLAAATQGVDLSSVIEAVRHRMLPGPSAGSLESESRLYKTAVDDSGLRISLRRREAAPAHTRGKASRTEAIPFEGAPAFSVELTAVRRGGTALALEPGAWMADANQALRLVAPGVTERATAREGQTEWDLVFDRPAPGAIVVEARVTALGGPELLGSLPPDGRVHDEVLLLPRPAWRWAAGADRYVRMGEMVVKDALGNLILRALPEPTADGIRMVIPADRLAGAVFPVTLDPVISPEYVLSDPVFGSVPLETQNFPAAASDGQNFLIVWEDARTSDTWDVWGALLASNGTLITKSGFLVDSTDLPLTGGSQPTPAVAWNGSNYAVVWEDSVSGANVDLRAARVDPQTGAILDPGGVVIVQAPANQEAPGIASDGSGFLIVWSDLRTGSADVYGALVDAALAPAGPGAFAINTSGGPQRNPEVLWNGADYVVVWDDERTGITRDIYLSRVDNLGNVIDGGGIAISTEPTADQVTPTIAYNGSTFMLITWRDFRNGAGSDIYACRFATDGTVFDPSGIAISTAANDQTFPVVAWDGAQFLVSWEDFRTGNAGNIVGARVSTGGGVLDPSGISLAAGTNSAIRALTTASNGTYTLTVTVGDRTAGNFHIYGIRIDHSGNVLDPTEILISAAADAQVRPAIAWNGVDYLVVWEDYSGGDANISGARVTPAGAVLDAVGILISSAANDQLTPAVAYDGANWLVVWSDFRSGTTDDVYAARVTAGGSVLDPIGIPVAQGTGDQLDPAVAWSGFNYLVVWDDSRIAGNADIFASRVTAGGIVLDGTGVPVSTASGAQKFPAVSYDGLNFVVAWQDSRGANTDIWASRVDISASVLDPVGIQLTGALNSQTRPAVASDGASTLVLWEDRRTGAAADLVGTRLTSGGILLDPAGIRITTAANDQIRPAVTWDGTNYVVVWQDLRLSALGDIYATRISSGGLPLPSGATGVVISNSVVAESVPRIVSGPGGRAAIAYQRFAPEQEQFAQRSFVRFFDECPASGPYTGPACGFVQVLPYHAFQMTAVDPPPTFFWSPGGQSLFRVEWGKKLQPFKAKVKSGKIFTPGTQYTPDAKTWSKIVKMAKKGRPVYWRVLAQDPLDKKVQTPSADVFALQISPIP